jgi:hypothetical protein
MRWLPKPRSRKGPNHRLEHKPKCNLENLDILQNYLPLRQNLRHGKELRRQLLPSILTTTVSTCQLPPCDGTLPSCQRRHDLPVAAISYGIPAG